MSNEEREYQAGNLPLPTDEEYEQDDLLEGKNQMFEATLGTDRIKVVFPMMTASDFLNDTLPTKTVQKVGSQLLEAGFINADQYFAYCENKNIKVF